MILQGKWAPHLVDLLFDSRCDCSLFFGVFSSFFTVIYCIFTVIYCIFTVIYCIFHCDLLYFHCFSSFFTVIYDIFTIFQQPDGQSAHGVPLLRRIYTQELSPDCGV